MTKDKVFGLLLLTTPLLIVGGFVLHSETVWLGVDVVAFFTTGLIGLSLLSRNKQ